MVSKAQERPFCFRLQFRMVTTLAFPEGVSSLLIQLPNSQRTATLSTNRPLKSGTDQWITIKSCGFPSEDEACSHAERLRDCILIAGSDGFGADFGLNKAKSQTADQLKQLAKEKAGFSLRDEIHGIDIFEDEHVRHLRIEISASALMNTDDFIEHLGGSLGFSPLDKVTRTGAELINDSYFPMPSEARFILRISAIEAMSPQSKRDGQTLDLLANLDAQAMSSGKNERVITDVRSVLREAKRQSVRQACLQNIRKHLTDDDIKTFDKLYTLRSKYVHDGLGRGELSLEAEQARDLSVRLLKSLMSASKSGDATAVQTTDLSHR